MNRRSFLTSAIAAAVALSDPERLLWSPGAKKIFIPPVPRLAFRKDAFQLMFTGPPYAVERFTSVGGVMWVDHDGVLYVTDGLKFQKISNISP